MISKQLDVRQKQVVVALSKELMRADGYINPQEIDYLQQLCGELGLDNSTTSSHVDYNNLSKIFDNPEIRCELLKELIALANIDNYYDLCEKDYIKYIADNLLVNTETLKELESNYKNTH